MYHYHQTSTLFALETPTGFEAAFTRDGLTYRRTAKRRTIQIFESNEPFFIKQHHGVGVKEILKNVSQGKWPIIDAHSEWRALTRLQSLGIACPTPIGVASHGFNPATRRSLIVTRAEPYAISLEYVWKDATTLSYATRQRLIIAIARTARSMHQAGIAHRDFYLCHLWLRLSPHDPTLKTALHAPKLLIMDLHRATCSKTLSHRARIKDLAALYFSVQSLNLTYKERLRFLKYYFEQSLRELSIHKKLFWAIADRTYHLIQRHHWKIEYANHYRQDHLFLLRSILSTPDRWLHQASMLYKDDAASTVVQMMVGGRFFILKRYNLKNNMQRIKRLLGFDKTARACKNAWWLLQAGITTPQPLAYGTHRQSWWRPIHYLVTEYLPGTLAFDMCRHDKHVLDNDSLQQRITRCQNQLAAIGISHGDWKATNVLLHQHHVILLDTDGVKRCDSQLRQLKDRARWEKNWRVHAAG